jgi:sugar lactone lactonase YvrE
MGSIRPFSSSLLRLQMRLLVGAPMLLLLLATRDMAVAQGPTRHLSAGGGGLNSIDPTAPTGGAVYESSFRNDTVEIFSSRGVFLGTLAKVSKPTGLVFDIAGNLYVASNDRTGFSITKFAIDGSVSTFGDSSLLNGPHGLAFDTAGNLYVANAPGNTIVKFTPDGVGTVFADVEDGLNTPIDLAFDVAGNLYVSNAHGGGTTSEGTVLKFTPDGVASTFADVGFQTAYGLAFDSAGNLYVSNLDGNTIEKFDPTGIDLGVFGSAGLNGPLGIMFDRAGNLYVANQDSNTIEKLSPTGADLGVFASTRGGPHFLAMFKKGHVGRK